MVASCLLHDALQFHLYASTIQLEMETLLVHKGEGLHSSRTKVTGAHRSLLCHCKGIALPHAERYSLLFKVQIILDNQHYQYQCSQGTGNGDIP